MNHGGFSWKRLLGVSAFKSRTSRKIGIPLTASGRRRKLGASIFNAVGPVVGTLAVAAVAATEQTSELDANSMPPQPHSSKGVHFCLVKGVTHNNDDGTSRREAQTLCSIGDTVKLIPEPNNEHDRHAIKVVLQTGQQIGYISATQAARFDGIVHLLTATVDSRTEDEWGNSTIKLRVVNSAMQIVQGSALPTPQIQPARHDTASDVQKLQTEAKEEAKRQGWKPDQALIYFENADRGLYEIVLAVNTIHMRQTLEAGLSRVGFIGGRDTPKGIHFDFSLPDSFPVDGIVAKRFLVNAREWVVNRSKDLCAQNGVPAPIVHDLEFSKEFSDAQHKEATSNVVSSKADGKPFRFGFVLGIAGFLFGLFTGEWRLTFLIILIVGVSYGVSLSRRLT